MIAKKIKNKIIDNFITQLCMRKPTVNFKITY